MRHCTLSRLAALCLVVLIALPFSAPFKTFDFANTDASSWAESLSKDKVDACDDVVSLPDGSVVPPEQTIVAVARPTRSGPPGEHLLSSTVLRL